MLELTEEELLNPARNLNETQGQYKSRRRILNHAARLYPKTDTHAFKTSYFEFVRLCIKLGKK